MSSTESSKDFAPFFSMDSPSARVRLKEFRESDLLDLCFDFIFQTFHPLTSSVNYLDRANLRKFGCILINSTVDDLIFHFCCLRNTHCLFKTSHSISENITEQKWMNFDSIINFTSTYVETNWIILIPTGYVLLILAIICSFNPHSYRSFVRSKGLHFNESTSGRWRSR